MGARTSNGRAIRGGCSRWSRLLIMTGMQPNMIAAICTWQGGSGAHQGERRSRKWVATAETG